MTKFAYPKQQQLYDLFLISPPTRSTSGGLGAAYWRGRNDAFRVMNGSTYPRGSLAYAAWRAGKKARAIAHYYRERGTSYDLGSS